MGQCRHGEGSEVRMTDPASPFDARGEMNPAAWINVLVALILKSGGWVELTYAELNAAKQRQFEYHHTETGMRFSMIDPREGQA